MSDNSDATLMTALVVKSLLRRQPEFVQTKWFTNWIVDNKDLIIKWNKREEQDDFVLKLPRLRKPTA